MSKISKLIYICITTALLAGCWDTLNIEERGFVLGIAVDMPKNNNEEKESYLVTSQLVVPAKMTSSQTGGGGGGSGEKPYLNVSLEGRSIYKNEEEIAGVTSKIPYYEHLTLLIISRDLAEKEHAMSHLLDPFVRDTLMRRNIKVITADGSAKDLLDISPPEETLPAMYFIKLLDHSKKNSGYYPALSLGDLDEKHFAKRSYVLPLLKKMDDHVDYRNGAVFQGPKGHMVGVLDEEHMSGLEFFTEKARAKVHYFEYAGQTTSLQVIKQQNKLSIDAKDKNHIKVKLHINLDSTIKEDFSNVDLNNKQTLNAIQKAASENVEKMIHKTINKAQNEYNADIFGIWKKLEISNYDIWKQIKDDWEKGENYFSKVTFDVNVDTEIYTSGTSNQTW